MADGNSNSKDLRVLVVAPIGRDAELVCRLLRKQDILCEACDGWECALRQMHTGAGAVVIAEEALTPSIVQRLSGFITEQPAWSDFPLILLTASGAVTASSLRQNALREPLGNVLLLERPVRPETMVSTVQGALRARRRQYQIRDQILQQQQAEEALRKSEKLAIAGRMAASIAHEINNPLEAVTNLIYLCQRSNAMEEIKSYLSLAQQEMARVSAITTHTLRFYRESAKPAPVNLSEIVDSVLALFRSRLSTAAVTLEKDYEDVPPVLGLSGELRQLFANLIGNAIDAMSKGGRLRVKIRANSFLSRAGAGVCVTIADTGTGMSADVRKKIFEPFFTTKGITGTGLGLWVSSEIVAKHSGRLRVKSSVHAGKCGTVFSIFLPMEPAAGNFGEPRLKQTVA